MKHSRILSTITVLLPTILLTGPILDSPVLAEDLVVIGNQAPSFLRPPVRFEHPTETEPAQGYTYETHAYDTSGDDYYMLVCTTDSVETGEFPASCDGTLLCKSPITSSDSSAKCSASLPLEDQAAWYITVCDTRDPDQACSDVWDGTAPASEQTVPIAFPSTAAVTEDTSSVNSSRSIEEITYSTLLLLLLSSAALASPLLILSVKEREQAERTVVATSLFIITGTSIFGLLATWPQSEPPLPHSTTVLGETDTNSQTQPRYPYSPSQEGYYPIRREPIVNSPIVYNAAEDEAFPVIEEQDFWVKIELPSGRPGWILKVYVK